MELEYHSDGSVDYTNMTPLDGEEGELIDDEACFIDVRAITGMDIVSHLPLELALYLLSFLDLPSILACLRVCRYVHSHMTGIAQSAHALQVLEPASTRQFHMAHPLLSTGKRRLAC